MRFWALCGSMRGILVIYMNTRPFSLPVAVLAISLYTKALSLSLFLYLLPLLTRGGSGCAAVCVNTPVCVRVCECATPNERPPSGAHHGE